MVRICEVGPRDGLQNEKTLVSTKQKVELITKLIDAGIKKIEAVSFVNPKVIPQMADAEAVMKLLPKDKGVTFAGLVLSQSGLERALETSIDTFHVVTAISDAFNLKNVRRTVNQSIDELTQVIQVGVLEEKTVVGVLGTAFGCPFEGNIPIERLLHVSESFAKAGAKEITLADTTGMANPVQVEKIVKAFYENFGEEIVLALHFHNTRGLGLVNVVAGYQAGVRHFDSSIGGLGGCPFAPKAVGNVCTEDMVNMFERMGIKTAARLDKLIETAKWTEKLIGKTLDGMLMKI